jgi:hypothetical protein
LGKTQNVFYKLKHILQDYDKFPNLAKKVCPFGQKFDNSLLFALIYQKKYFVGVLSFLIETEVFVFH